MPKIKTNRGAAKRFRKTGGGRFKRAHAFHNHILTKKDSKRKRGLRAMTVVAEQDQAMIQRLVPYK
ncbi:MAG: 50S ribosomal protein L35 [Ectothiorhodospiraceae bacterium]|jgi:large subunit ribosomal protein L35